MAKKPNVPCISCGKLLWTNPKSAPADERKCRECRRLEAVPDEPAPVAVVVASMSSGSLGGLSAAVRAGDRKRALTALSHVLADQIPEADAREAASLSRELRATLGELASLSPATAEEAPKRDDLANRRAERRRTAGQ